MKDEEMQKSICRYTKLFSDAVVRKNISNHAMVTRKYSERVSEIYQSNTYQEYAKYPSIDREKVFAVIGMCLILKENKLTNEEIIEIVNFAFRRPKKVFYCLEKIVDALPCAYKIAEKWNLGDYEKRVKDGSIYYDLFQVDEGRIEYNVTKCMYVEAFTAFGIRELCKIFCITDEQAYANLTRHVKFQRYSDLSDGNSCHDVITRK